MHFAGLIALIWLSYYLVNRNNRNNTSSANNGPNIYLVALVWFLIPFLWLVFGVVFASNIETQSLKILTIFSSSIISTIFLIPSIFAKLTIRLGLVKTSYILGKLSLKIHFKDPHSGAFFYAWLALQYASPEKKEHLREWLQTKISKFQKTIGSGMMAMQIIIKNGLNNKQALIQQLNFLTHCNPKWLPNNIATYCYRTLLVDACKKKRLGNYC